MTAGTGITMTGGSITTGPLTAAGIIKLSQSGAVGGIHVSKDTFQNDVWFWRSKKQDDPRKFAIVHQQVRTPAEEFVRDVICVKKGEQAGNALVFGDAKQVGGAADGK